VRLPNGTKVDAVFEPDKEIVVQDYSSQRISGYFDTGSLGLPAPGAWDCCAASGGKSIMLHDLYPDIDLTVSDIRESILINLKKRFKAAGIDHYKSFIADLTAANSHPAVPGSPFDLIIADLPCTGSGTWSRNPEALYFFDEKEMERYSVLQKKIINTIMPRLKKGGALVYITCSVFKKENEEVVDFIRQQFQLRLEKMQLLKGYDQRADSMFAARFIRAH
jgi:16S rRNA (cytosine967-C5)-methyltransferase